jgi:hypothetical protein
VKTPEEIATLTLLLLAQSDDPASVVAAAIRNARTEGAQMERKRLGDVTAQAALAWVNMLGDIGTTLDNAKYRMFDTISALDALGELIGAARKRSEEAIASGEQP